MYFYSYNPGDEGTFWRSLAELFHERDTEKSTLIFLVMYNLHTHQDWPWSFKQRLIDRMMFYGTGYGELNKENRVLLACFYAAMADEEDGVE